MSSKISFGILPFVHKNNTLYVVLCHPGGPYYKNINTNWTISKGEVENFESAADCALREFKEETGLTIEEGKVRDAIRVCNCASANTKSGNKLVICFFVEFDEMFSLASCHSNMFTIEEGKCEGSYPEINDYRWMTIEEAESCIENYQLPLLYKLKEITKE